MDRVLLVRRLNTDSGILSVLSWVLLFLYFFPTVTDH